MVSLQTHLRWLRATAVVCALVAFACVEAPRAQSSTSAPDSLGGPSAPRSALVDPLPAAPFDSLGMTGADSLGFAGADSLGLPSSVVDGEGEAPPRMAPWNPQAPVTRSGLDGLRPESMVEAGERIWNLERDFNMRAGMTADQDTLPKRLLKDAANVGPAKGRVNDLDQMLPEYYALRGWTTDGKITPETRSRFGI